MAENETQMTPEEVNRLLGYLYTGATWKKYVDSQHPADEAQAKAVWDDTVKWMEDHPLQPGQVWGMVPE